MAPGPHLIFDKSALQSLSLDESNWFDNFYSTVITPLFFVETLADLEKEVGRGRTPEQIVGSLAIRTPDMGSTACAHHRKLLGGVLYGHELPLDGRIPRNQGQVVELGDKKGVFYSESEEGERSSAGTATNSSTSKSRLRRSGDEMLRMNRASRRRPKTEGS
jgi:hypothetical protein